MCIAYARRERAKGNRGKKEKKNGLGQPGSVFMFGRTFADGERERVWLVASLMDYRRGFWPPFHVNYRTCEYERYKLNLMAIEYVPVFVPLSCSSLTRYFGTSE